MLRIRNWRGLGFLSATLKATLVLLAITAIPTFSLAEPARRSLDLDLDEVPGSSSYEIRVIHILGDGTKKPPMMFSLTGTHWSAKLTPGKYTMEVRSYDSRHVPGSWSDPQEFVVKLPLAELVAPTDAQVIKSEDLKTEKVQFEWHPVEGAQKYKVKILNDDGTVVQETLETEAQLKVKLPVGREYAWSVIPVMEGEVEGEAAINPWRFQIFGGKLE